MNLLLVPVLVPFFFFLPGYLISRTLFRNPGAFSAGERWYLPVALSVCATTWIAFTLAEFGVFSLLSLSALLLLFCLALWMVARKKFATWSLRDFKPDWIFIATFALAIFLFAHPAEYIIGNSDAGTYINTGASIARTGGIAIHDAQVQALPVDTANTFYWALTNPYMLYKLVRLPGFFIANPAQGLVLPQFLHFYPSWLAIWDALLGVQWGLYATPIIALLGTLAFYFLAKNLLGKNFARLAFFLLVVTVPQFWFARYPVAEAMTQFLVLLGMFALLKMMRGDAPSENRVGLGLVAGVAFGQVFFTRADAVLLLVPIALYALLLIFRRTWRREHWALFGAFGIVLVQAVAHMIVFSPDYLYYQYSHALRMQNIDKLFGVQLPDAASLFADGAYLLFGLGAALLGIVALFIIDRLVQMLRARWGQQAAARFAVSEKYFRLGGAVLILILFIAFYFVLPHPESLYAYVGGLTPARSEANLIKLGWYVSPIGIGLAALGGMIVLLRDLNARNAFLYATGALFTLLYLDELYSTPHYIYTTRHYIPIVIPLFILLAARALQWMWQEWFASARPLHQFARAAAASAFVLWMMYNAYAMGLVDASRATGVALRVPFVTQTIPLGIVHLEPFDKSIVGVAELGGAFNQISALADQLDPNGVIVFSAGRDEPAAIATPLKYIFGRDAFVTVFNNPPGSKVASMIDGWRAQGRDVILAYGTNGGKLQIPHYSLEPVGEFAFDAPQWAFAYDFMPRSAWDVNLNYALYRAVPRTAPEPYPVTLHFGGQDFPNLVSGFLERAPEEQTRWIGTLLGDDQKASDWKWITGRLWLPANDAADSFQVSLRARAPRDNVRLQLKSGDKILGDTHLTANFADYTFQISRADLKTNGDGYLVDLVSQTTTQDGRVLGAELDSLTLR